MLIHLLTKTESLLTSSVHILGGTTELVLLAVLVGIALGKAPAILTVASSLLSKLRAVVAYVANKTSSVISSIKSGLSKAEVELHLKSPSVVVAPVTQQILLKSINNVAAIPPVAAPSMVKPTVVVTPVTPVVEATVPHAAPTS